MSIVWIRCFKWFFWVIIIICIDWFLFSDLYTIHLGLIKSSIKNYFWLHKKSKTTTYICVQINFRQIYVMCILLNVSSDFFAIVLLSLVTFYIVKMNTLPLVKLKVQLDLHLEVVCLIPPALQVLVHLLVHQVQLLAHPHQTPDIKNFFLKMLK